ncbi:Xaa-Pro dipeptidase [Marivirga tractuosa]|uniref:Amidohydrolase n=1 Tax=Marivirga tractuosa (strain ATCC 23168 / DSM 4126 / NBRC 15989 / NCIMB 1408 / VKM B-1430 / H-43) TaxID=643867 RepID=E4TLE2_MARTH|nr:amidohydrolase family protein [Marivirga tractuosa]ADR21263.1 amidohydrolase [Marivirga tractuosa DSM 4126]BDD14283.1 Xaa-Pro dipeptidase [Marivirga tractuosa]
MKKLYLFLFMVSVSFNVIAQTTYLHCGKVIDVEKSKVLTEMTIIIEGDKIKSVEKGYSDVPENAKAIDLKSKTVMPGLFDMHVHLESETSKDGYIKRFTLNDADVAFQSTVYAKKTLMAGFTSVRDLGGSGVNSSLRDAINKGYVDGPTIYSAGKSIATTGGHADPTNGYKDDLMGNPGPAEGVVNSPEEARKAVRQRYKNGADVIKITATAGVLSMAKNGQNPQFFEDELKAIVETANDYGMLTAAHAHGDEGMQRAIRAGIKTIEHGTLMSEETMELMKEYDAYYVPTITAGKSVAELAEIEGYYPEVVVPKAKAIGPKIQDTFGKAYKKGVNIAFGTDAGVFKHGDNGKEFGYMVEAGMKPMESIISATVTPAKLLKVYDKYGSISEGKMADIIAVSDDPTENIKTMESVDFVMKKGVVYKNQ